MKFIPMYIASWGMIFLIVPMLVGCSIFGCYLAIQQNDYRFLCFSIFSIFGLVVLALQARDLFSIVIIDERGVEAKLFGMMWFSVKWSEMQYIADFEMSTNITVRYICFSKEPIRFTKRIFYSLVGYNSYLKGKAMIMIESEKVKQEVLKYVPSEKIENLGQIKIRNLPKN